MRFSYKKLWKLLIDRDIKKNELCRMAGISSATLAKMARGESVTTDSLLKICTALGFGLFDIAEVVASDS